MKRQDLIAKARLNGQTPSSAQVVFKKVHGEKQIVYGEVYAPEIVDSHGDVMSREELEKLAHKFLLQGKAECIDTQHNNVKASATAVESFIARPGDPDFTEGAWVLAVKVHDNALWADIKSGKYNGYSMEIYTYKEEVPVTVNVLSQMFGKTEDSNGHSHVYYVKLDNNGKVIGGHTSADDGHTHKIMCSSSTEDAVGHSHRYFLL
jgi:hypothetical protein